MYCFPELSRGEGWVVLWFGPVGFELHRANPMQRWYLAGSSDYHDAELSLAFGLGVVGLYWIHWPFFRHSRKHGFMWGGKG